MTPPVPRLRMFAGPNGSGKSTIKAQVDEGLWGQFVNADNIEAEVGQTRSFDFTPWQIETSDAEIRAFFQNSWVKTKRSGWETEVEAMRIEGARVHIGQIEVNSYLATVIADFLRERLLAGRASFTFETVMSDRSKVRFLEEAQAAGYRTYLYYVATRDPEINISRVANRVQSGGHPVREDKIRERYSRSLDLLFDAIRASNRAYLWDNSGASAVCFAEFENKRLVPRRSDAPVWFKTFVLDKVTLAASSGTPKKNVIAERAYEITYIVVPDNPSGVEQVQAEVRALIEGAHGVIDQTSVSEVRELALTPKKKAQGIYVVINARFPSSLIQELDSSFKFDPRILKHIILSDPE